MRLMVWHLTDDGSQVKVTTTIGEVIAEIERFSPDTVVFNSRTLGQAKDACIGLIRQLVADVRIIDMSASSVPGARRFIDITDHDEGNPAREGRNDVDATGSNLISMVNRKRAAG
jgi:hypothetical protein